MPNIYALCATANGMDIVAHLDGKVPVRGIIGLAKRPASDLISNLIDAQSFCKSRGIEHVQAESYSLQSEKDRDRLGALDIDLLLAFGWQRLVPEWLISKTGIGVLGAHGSANGIAGGRGLSPQNWALILGNEKFEVSLFWIEPGVDSGRILSSREFALTKHDTIATSHLKTSFAVSSMVIENWESGRIERREGRPQEGPIYYLPQRQPGDGAIDWNRSSRHVVDFVRALTRPYPGAFCDLKPGRMMIWRATEIDDGKNIRPANVASGTVLSVPTEGGFAVATADGIVFVNAWEITPSPGAYPEMGCILPYVDFSVQMGEIICRHRRKYPDLPIAPDIFEFSGPERREWA